VLGYYLRVRPLLVRSTLVVFDGYDQELLVDAGHFRDGGPPWLARLLAALTPMPDLMFVLDAPVDMLQSEGAIPNATHLRGRVIRVDPARPLGQVVDECADHTSAVMALRTAKRLHLN
jgi:thymidylate kinase